MTGSFVSTESKTSASAASKSPVKKAAGPKGPCPRKTKGRSGAANSDASQTPALEERRCPLDGCDSMGHLGGRADKHFTIDACPKYHNKMSQECKVIGCRHYLQFHVFGYRFAMGTKIVASLLFLVPLTSSALGFMFNKAIGVRFSFSVLV